MSKSSVIICLLLTLVLGVFFAFAADLDLAITHYFYVPVATFKLDPFAWAQISRDILYFGIWGMGIVVVLMVVLRFIRPQWPLWHRLKTKTLIYVLAVVILVPVILINGVFKDHFGRARPRDVVQFGGTQQFLPAWSISNECNSNCSFVCGDSSAAFVFWMFLPFFKKRRYKLLYGTVVFLVGAYYGFIRVGQGAHFFSDVVFSALISYLGIWLVYAYFYLIKPKWTEEEHLQAAFGKAHRFVFRD